MAPQNETTLALVIETKSLEHLAKKIWRAARGAATGAFETIAGVFNALTIGPELIQLVGPGERPKERHEFERRGNPWIQ